MILLKKGNNKITIIFIFILMTIISIADNVRGVAIPIFMKEFNINDTNIAIMLTVSSIGYILFTYIGGTLCEKIGQRKVYFVSLIITIISLLLLYMTKNFYMLLLNMFLFNVGISLVSIATNTIVPVLFLSFQGILMNLTHFCYGLGATISQRVSGIMIYNGIPWREIYLILALIFILYSILFCFISIPKAQICSKSEHGMKKNIYKNKLLYLYMITLGFYVFSESGTLNWFTNLMEKSYGFNTNKSSLYLSLFFGMFTFGRLVAGFIVEKFGYINTVARFLAIALVLYLTGLVLKDKGVIIIGLAGFFMAATFATIVTTVSKVFKEHASYATGVIITAASTISMVLNAVIGKLNVTLGVYNSYYLIPICLLITATFAAILNRNTKGYFLRSDKVGK